MKASELRPGQHQYFLNWRGERCLFVRHRGPFDNNPECGFVVYVKEIGDSFTIATQDWDLDVTPLAVHGWDDEPQSEPRPMKPTPAMQRISEVMGEYQSPQDSPVKPAPLQLREGAWYRRRDGKVVGPLESFSPSDERHYKQPWRVWNGEYYDTYYDDGYWNVQREEQSLDLIAEVPPPVEPEQFKAGDWVVCVDGNCDVVTGSVYQVASIDSDDLIYVGVKRDGYFRRRFRRATPAEVAAYQSIRGLGAMETPPRPAAQEPQPDLAEKLRYWWVQWVTPPTLDDLMTTDKRGEP